MSGAKRNKLAVVVLCIDYRFWPQALPLLQKRYGVFDLIAMAGASKEISSPAHHEDWHAALESIRASVRLHQPESIILTNHIDCGAYGGSKHFHSRKEELAHHTQELRTAKKIMKHRFPKLQIETLILMRTKNNRVSLRHG